MVVRTVANCRNAYENSAEATPSDTRLITGPSIGEAKYSAPNKIPQMEAATTPSCANADQVKVKIRVLYELNLCLAFLRVVSDRNSFDGIVSASTAPATHAAKETDAKVNPAVDNELALDSPIGRNGEAVPITAPIMREITNCGARRIRRARGATCPRK